MKRYPLLVLIVAASARAALVEGARQRYAARRRLAHPFPWKDTIMTGLTTDIRHACRRLAARPLTAALAIGMLALAIGVFTAMFTVVDAVMLRPVPFPGADRARLAALLITSAAACLVPARRAAAAVDPAVVLSEE